jgi:hypothetical protein
VPKRTTAFQAIVNFVREHTAAPGVTVTESKELLDARTGAMREVDVVVEGDFDGEHVVTSIEVTEPSRPADWEWVDKQIKKHSTLPTNLLILVSKSGFTPNALTAVAAEGGRVQTMTPKIIEKDGEAVVQSVYMDQIQLTPTLCGLIVQDPNGEKVPVQAGPDWIIFDAIEHPLGLAFELAREFVSIQSLVKTLMEGAHSHPERDDLKTFAVGAAIGGLEYYLRKDDTGQLHKILAIEVQGKFGFQESDMPFTASELGGRKYAAGEGLIFGRKGVWVATTDKEAGTTTISWRTKEYKPGTEPPPIPPRKFPGLDALEDNKTDLEILNEEDLKKRVAEGSVFQKTSEP